MGVMPDKGSVVPLLGKWVMNKQKRAVLAPHRMLAGNSVR